MVISVPLALRVKVTENHLFFARQEKKKIFFLSCGATPSRTVPKTQPLQVAFSVLERVDLRSQKKGILREENCLGKRGWKGENGKKERKKKRMRPKRWGYVRSGRNDPSFSLKAVSKRDFKRQVWPF